MKIKISVSIDDEVYKVIVKKAQDNNRSVSNFIEQTFRIKYAKELKDHNEKDI